MSQNAHRALNSASDATYLKQLRLPLPKEQELRDARDIIRDALREGIRDWESSVPANRMLVEDAIVALNAEGFGISDAVGQPKFRMQGSFSYHTVNDPPKGKAPPLQVDLDDGMFLPTKFISRNGTLEPSVAAEGYFEAVGVILEDVSSKNGWKLHSKKSCVRVELDDEAHIDVALYAVPEKEFASLVETARIRGELMKDSHNFDDDAFSKAIYDRLSPDEIRLAQRDDDGNGSWIRSDPRKLEAWFQDAVKVHGDQIRFVSRYLKAWRDEDDLDGLASIALMSATITTFEKIGGYKLFEGRDDLALLAVAEALPELLKNEIPNPVIPNERLDQGWSQSRRSEFVDAASKLASSLSVALNDSDNAERTIEIMRSELGTRFPTDQHLILDGGAPETMAAPAALTHGLIDKEHEPDGREAVKLDGDERYA